MDLSRILVKAW